MVSYLRSATERLDVGFLGVIISLAEIIDSRAPPGSETKALSEVLELSTGNADSASYNLS